MSDDLLQTAIDSLAIDDVYLRQTHVAFKNDFDPKVPGQSLDMQLRISTEGVEELDGTEVVQGESEQHAVKLVRIRLGAGLRFMPGGLSDEIKNSPDELPKYVRAEINASFVAEYRVTRDGLSREAIEEFAKRNAAYHVWPYWREYVQSVCARTRLPNVIVPLFQLPRREKKPTDSNNK